MPHDPEVVEETKAWFAKAQHDLRVAELSLQDKPPLTDQVVYHSQQAAEKSLKGFLAWHGQTFRKTHNLEEIGEQCLGIDPSLKELIDEAAPLTEYAWQYRYPGDLIEPSHLEAEEVLETAKKVFTEILIHLPSEVRPLKLI